MTPSDHIAFTALAVPNLQRFGIHGRQPRVSCVQAALRLQDERGGTATIPASRVHCLRVGASSSSSGRFLVAHVHLEADGARAPLLLRAANPHDRAFAQVLRSFACEVANARGIAALQHGTGTSVGVFVAVLLIAVLASVLALTVWAREFGLGGAAAFTAAMGVIVALVGWDSLYRSRPRPIRSLDELDRILG